MIRSRRIRSTRVARDIFDLLDAILAGIMHSFRGIWLRATATGLGSLGLLSTGGDVLNGHV
jgi:hypothetical protein